MASSGPFLPTTATNDTSIGSATWATLSDGLAADGLTVNVTHNFNGSYFFKTGGHGFSIPAGATIDGIYADGLACTYDGAQQWQIKLAKAGVVGGADRSSGANWPSGFTPLAVSWGGPSDLWGTTWTPADINNAGFGIALSSTSSATRHASVDYVRLTVYYTPAAVNKNLTMVC